MNAKVVTKQKWKYGLGNENFSIFSGEVVIAHTVGCDIYTDGENAARIVRAVNSHGDLLAALQECMKALGTSDLSASAKQQRCSEAFQSARAAIERATKG